MRDDGYQALTEREKATLRLLVAGHDAKSVARHLGLSVHTVNERLRVARRKMAVSSSREAARLLHAAEAATPELSVDTILPGASADIPADSGDRPPPARSRHRIAAALIGGFTLMTLLLALLALAASPQTAPAPNADPAPATTAGAPTQAALQWLALVDAGQWGQSWAETGAAFRRLNTRATWAKVSDAVRVPLGTVVSRTAAGEDDVPAPPYGYRMVRFHTSFANRANVVETLSLEREDGRWRVVGYTIA